MIIRFVKVLYKSGTIVDKIKNYFGESIWNPVMLITILLFMPGIALGNIGVFGIVFFFGTT